MNSTPIRSDYEPPIESRLGARELQSKYPLEMISAKSHDSMNSTFGNQAAALSQTSTLFLHSDDAQKRGIRDRRSCPDV